jgi:hypothetical protein
MARKPTPARSTWPRTESPSVEALTVGWMLTVVTTLFAELATTTLGLWLAARPAAGESLRSLFQVAVLASPALGLVTLGLTGGVMRTRRVPAPRAITAAAIVIGVAPLLAFVVVGLLR